MILLPVIVRSSCEYISLKKICHYNDPSVPEVIQKKTYGIVAPLFSKNLFKSWIPWKKSFELPICFNKTSYDFYPADPRIHSLYYVLKLFCENFPSDLFSRVFAEISSEFDMQPLFSLRQYGNWCLQLKNIPFLNNDQLWFLQSENGYLFSQDDIKTRAISVKLTCYKHFNYQTLPIAILKVPSTEFNSENLVLCLFLNGCMNLIDLTAKKQLWLRPYYPNQKNDDMPFFDDKLLNLITGYKNTVCFGDKNFLNFYTIYNVTHDKPCQYSIQNDKFNMLYQRKYIGLTALNLCFFFYTFSYYKPTSGFSRELLPRITFKSGRDDLNRSLYYVSYKDQNPQETVLITLDESSNFFVCLSCNDSYLIARDNQNNLYVFDIQKEPFLLKKTIRNAPNELKEFWLDSDSEKLLTEYGIFKIQDSFEGLLFLKQNDNFKKSFGVKYSFIKGLLMRVVWLLRSQYWRIKNCVIILLSFIKKKIDTCGFL